jgi:hypothetical protein
MNRAERPSLAGSGSRAYAADLTSGRRPAEPDPTPRELSSAHRRPVRVVGTPPPTSAAEPAEAALRSLPVAGISRRRLAWIAGVVVSVWVVAVFARQVGEASAAAARADGIRADNDALATQVAALQHERDIVQQRSYVEFIARGYRLGTARDQAFTLAPNAPPLSADAAGSAAHRVGAPEASQAPLDSWLSLLFGPSR